MTQGIDNTLNLPHMEDIIKSSSPVVEIEEDEEDDLFNVAEFGSALATLGSNHALDITVENGHGEAMDELHKKTLAHADDLMDLGHNVDQRSMATIFEKANMLYKTALDAKATKMDAQIKLRKLMLDERKLALEEMKIRHEMGKTQEGAPGDSSNDVEAMVVMDRNALVAKWREEMSEEIANAEDDSE